MRRAQASRTPSTAHAHVGPRPHQPTPSTAHIGAASLILRPLCCQPLPPERSKMPSGLRPRTEAGGQARLPGRPRPSQRPRGEALRGATVQPELGRGQGTAPAAPRAQQAREGIETRARAPATRTAASAAPPSIPQPRPLLRLRASQLQPLGGAGSQLLAALEAARRQPKQYLS